MIYTTCLCMAEQQIKHYLTLQEYATEQHIDWRTAKKRVADWTLLLFKFRKKKVYIEKDQLVLFLINSKNG